MIMLTVAALCAVGLGGWLAGDLWRRHRSALVQDKSDEEMAVLRSALDVQIQKVGSLQAELLVQHQRCFSLEEELEARENDWARSSPAPVSFDAQTFRIDRSGIGGDKIASHKSWAENHPSAPVPTHGLTWAELDAANSEHGALDEARPAAPQAARASGPAPGFAPIEIAGLERRIEALRSGHVPAFVLPAGGSVAVEHLGQRDDLKLIQGIDSELEGVLNAAGYRQFRDITSATPEELTWALAAAGPAHAGTTTDTWLDQARQLAERRDPKSGNFAHDAGEGARRASC
jgi:predicted flap endonuclease-1-like 5' DNA nuclease